MEDEGKGYRMENLKKPGNKDNKKSVMTVVRWLGTGFAVGIMIYILSKVGWQEALDSFKGIPWWVFVIALILGLISRFSTWGRWHTLLAASEEKIDAKTSLKLTFAGLFASNVLPSTIGGDVVRLAGGVRAGLSVALSTASLVVDRLVGLSGMVLALPFALKFLPMLQSKPTEGAFAFAAGTGFFGKIWNWIKKTFANILDSLKYWLKQPMSLVKSVGFTLIHQACIYLIIKLFINAMGEDLPILTIAGLWSLTYFITLLPISINGLGLQEVTVTNLFSALGGISIQTSLALAIFLRILWMVVSLPGAFFIGDTIAGKQDNMNLENENEN